MAEWLGNGLQNRVQQFESAWYLKTLCHNWHSVFSFIHSEKAAQQLSNGNIARFLVFFS